MGVPIRRTSTLPVPPLSPHQPLHPLPSLSSIHVRGLGLDDFFDFVEGDLDGVGAGFGEGLEVADVPYSVVGSEIGFNGI